MQNKIAGIIIFSLFIFFSCKKEDVFTSSQESQKLEGYWVNRQITDTLFTFEKSENLVTSQYGLAFFSGGKFIERKNAGWCGTPPIAYADFEGSWLLSDSIVSVTVGYWGGTSTYRWRVVAVDSETLAIEVLSEDYSQEN